MGLGSERSVFVFERGRPGSPDSRQYQGWSEQGGPVTPFTHGGHENHEKMVSTIPTVGRK